uniref:GIY-YIG endonuclease n=1 Tax=Rhizopogon vinicolor TaxID=80600 RepID=A0A4Y5SJQ8_9AGAM|nr:GIY-YIG endonuclease [Rhizopogon vinicolor]QDA23236.1 GIY-YIG endonuclease [Rhizopogon vinicolor]
MLSDLAKNRVHSEATKTLISRALVGENNPFYNKTHSTESKLRIIEANSAHPVYVYNSYKILQVIFPSVLTLAKLINSNHSTILGFINSGELFRGEWYFSKLPYNISDIPLMLNFSSIEFNNLISDMKKNSHIKKAVFLYNLKRDFIKKFDGVTHTKRELNITHGIIKIHALRNKPYQAYIFS